ncbi:MAG: glycosyltransferase [Chloroflexi bacterium]|nr:glycosyltransferase [Chloroflexota bacterium]
MRKNRRLRVALLAPIEPRLDPYAELLADGIRRAGCRCVVQRAFSLRWYLRCARDLDVLHLHWLEFVYAAQSTTGTIRKLISLILALLIAKMIGAKVVYTVHDVVPRTSKYPYLSWLANQVVFRVANRIHVHDVTSRQRVVERFGRAVPIYVIPHGNYVGVYPNSSTRIMSRLRLGLPERAFVYLFLGQIHPNTGVEDLILAFTGLRDPDALLLIAGWSPDEAYGASLHDVAGGDHRVIMRHGLVDAADIQYYMKACDICVLPYPGGTTMGAVLLAFSFGKPVIAPNVDNLRDLVLGDRGILYDGTEVTGLLQSLRAGSRMDLRRAEAAALTLARRFDWLSIGRQHVIAYRTSGASFGEFGPGAAGSIAHPEGNLDTSTDHSIGLEARLR